MFSFLQREATFGWDYAKDQCKTAERPKDKHGSRKTGWKLGGQPAIQRHKGNGSGTDGKGVFVGIHWEVRVKVSAEDKRR
jgi:hypothetical protein